MVHQPGGGHSALGLMIQAAQAALADSGAPGLADAVDLVMMPVGTWPYRNPGPAIAQAIGAPGGARTVMLSVGIPQQALFNEAYAAIASGQARAVLIVGGEAAHRAAVARRARVTLDEPGPGCGTVDSDPDELRPPSGEIVAPAELRAGVVTPVVQYALIDSALRAAEGVSPSQHAGQIDRLWAAMSAAAGQDMPAPGRLMAFPYRAEHCSRINVDQAAAVLVCDEAIAAAAGVPAERIVHPLVALQSSHAVPVVRRARLDRWPAMNVLGAAAAGHIARSLAAIEHVEVYSCFPSAVRVQQRELGLHLQRAPTLTGGMACAGGPWNNFVLQATVEMVRRLREHPGELGMVTTVSGFLTKPGLAIYSTDPGCSPPLVADLADHAAQATATVEVAGAYEGLAVIDACTVVPRGDGVLRTVAVATTIDARRCLATSDDPRLAALVMEVEMVGAQIGVMDGLIDRW